MSKVQGFRMSKEAIKALDDLTKKFNAASLIPLTKTQIIEILVLSANQKSSSELLALLQRKTKLER